MRYETDWTSSLRLRPSGPHDAASILLVWSRSTRVSHRFLSLQDLDELTARLGGECLIDARFVLAESEGLVIGFMGRTGPSLDYLFVDPMAHRQGIGTALLRHAEEAPGPIEARIHVRNTGAVSFLAHRGFEIVKRSRRDADGRPYPTYTMKRAGGPIDGRA